MSSKDAPLGFSAAFSDLEEFLVMLGDRVDFRLVVSVRQVGFHGLGDRVDGRDVRILFVVFSFGFDN